METPNAFIGKATLPTEHEVSAALGSTAEVWKQLVDWLAEQGVADQEWKSSSPKYGWSLRMKAEKENDRLSRSVQWLLPGGIRPRRQGSGGRQEERSIKERAQTARRSPALRGGNRRAAHGEGKRRSG